MLRTGFYLTRSQLNSSVRQLLTIPHLHPSPVLLGDNFGTRRVVVRLVRGAVAGALVGCALLGIGLLRFYAARGTEEQAGTELRRDLHGFAYYLAGLALAGALINVLQPLFPGKTGTYVRFAIGGALVMLMIAAGDQGGIRALHTFDWIALSLVGAGFGCAMAFGYTQGPSELP